MGKTEAPGVQCLPAEGLERLHERLRRTLRQCQPASVHRVADNRMTNVGEVHSNLMGTACLKPDGDMGMRSKPSNDPVMRNGLASAPLPHAHALAVNRVTSDRRINRATCRHDAGADCFVFALDCPFCKCGNECRVCRQRLGNHQQSRSILVKPVYDTGAWNVHERGAMVEQGVLHGGIRIAGARVDHQSRRLVDDQQSVILKHDLERNLLRREVDFGFDLGPQRPGLAPRNNVPGPRLAPVQLYLSRFNPLLYSRTRISRQQAGKHLIKPLSRIFGRNLACMFVTLWQKTSRTIRKQS